MLSYIHDRIPAEGIPCEADTIESQSSIVSRLSGTTLKALYK
jgi:hypothetical protein